MNKQVKHLPLPLSPHVSGAPPFQPRKWNMNKPLKHSHNCYAYMLNDLLTIPRRHGKPQPGYFVDHVKKMKRNMKMTNFERISCKEVKNGVQGDNPFIQMISLQTGRKSHCSPNHYKGFLMVSPGGDYHFARQDNRLIPVFRSIHRSFSIEQLHTKTPTEIAKVFLDECYKKAQCCVVTALQCFPRDMHYSKSPIIKMKAIIRCSRLWSHKPGQTAVTDVDASGNYIVDPETADWDYSKGGGINYSQMCCYFHIPKNSFQPTHSTGIPSPYNQTKNSVTFLTPKLSSLEEVDAKYEKLIRTICMN